MQQEEQGIHPFDNLLPAWDNHEFQAELRFRTQDTDLQDQRTSECNH